MTTQVQQALALLFRRFKDGRAPETELAKVMSLTLNWTKPSRARNLLNRGLNAGYLARDGDELVAQFDPDEIEVAFGFRPGDELFETVETAETQTPATEAAESRETTETPEPEGAMEMEAEAGTDPATNEEAEPPGPAAPPEDQPVLERLLDAIAEHLDGDRKAAVAEVNAKQDRLGESLTLDAAALLVAAEHGIDPSEHARAVLKRLRA